MNHTCSNLRIHIPCLSMIQRPYALFCPTPPPFYIFCCTHISCKYVCMFCRPIPQHSVRVSALVCVSECMCVYFCVCVHQRRIHMCIYRRRLRSKLRSTIANMLVILPPSKINPLEFSRTDYSRQYLYIHICTDTDIDLIYMF